MVGIIDYGMGNLRSVQKAFEYLGIKAQIISERKQIRNVDKVVLPGVGAFQHAIKTIREKEIDKEVYEAINSGKFFLGICLGMQLLFEKSYENGEFEGLGIFEGNIVKFKGEEKIPHIGWNTLEIKKESYIFKNLPMDAYVYFVHSYYADTPSDIVTATVLYEKQITVSVEKNNVYALQFHPEKSGDIGLTILKNFGGL